MSRILIILISLLIANYSFAADDFVIKFGYFSVDPNAKKATVIEETDKIKYGSKLPWGFTVDPKVKGTKFSIKTASKGTCDSEERSGPYTTEGYYEISTWDTDSKPCTREVSIYINDVLVKVISYEVLSK